MSKRYELVLDNFVMKKFDDKAKAGKLYQYYEKLVDKGMYDSVALLEIETIEHILFHKETENV